MGDALLRNLTINFRPQRPAAHRVLCLSSMPKLWSAIPISGFSIASHCR